MDDRYNTQSKPRLTLPVIVEGRYDKSTVLSIYDGTVITTDGFGVFNSKEKQLLIRRIAKDGIILLTDSDAGGKQIRSFISGIIPREKIYQVYIPRIAGKERRKNRPGKEGILGVEGVGADVIRPLLDKFTGGESVLSADITVTDLFELGLMGSDGASKKRDALCLSLGLPAGMNSKALLSALNIVSNLEQITEAVEKININEGF
jgi:ribonuclease M5